ncbi:protein spinster homolog 1-like [Ranitomeya variabilis]|uniref:protein spinster homolog 1-like n=1 Tax=Ranitomeya variabilis TaxID=490064 RepID=UPI004056B616
MASYVFIIIVEILLSLNFAIAADIRLYVVSPRRRSTGQAIVIMVSGLLVTAEGSNVIGKISDLIKAGKDDSDLSRFHSLQYALASCPFLLAIGGGLFLATSVFLENDRKCAEMESEVLITTD